MSNNFPKKYSEEYIKNIKKSISPKEYMENYLLQPPKCDVINFEGNQCSNVGVHEVAKGTLLCIYHYNELLQIEERHRQENKKHKSIGYCIPEIKPPNKPEEDSDET